MIDAFLKEAVAIVLGLVKADHLRYIQVLKDVDVAGSCMSVTMDRVTLVDWTHEGQELAWDDPVEVTIFDLLVVLVLTRIEGLEVVPSELDGLLEALEAVQDGALVVAVTAACIPKRSQVRTVLLELTESLLSVHLEDNDHECTHQVGGVGEFDIISGLRVVVNSRAALEAVTLQQLLEFAAEPVRHREVQRAEVLVEWHIGQILQSAGVGHRRGVLGRGVLGGETRLTYIVDIEEESIVDVLRGSLVSDPVKLIYKHKIEIVNKMSQRGGGSHRELLYQLCLNGYLLLMISIG